MADLNALAAYAAATRVGRVDGGGGASPIAHSFAETPAAPAALFQRGRT